MDRPPDLAALAALRPGDPKGRLVAAVGERWLEPHPALGGRVDCLECEVGFSARLDREGRIGEMDFKRPFDPNGEIAGVRIGMAEDGLRRLAKRANAEAKRRGAPDLPTPDLGRLHMHVEGGTMLAWISSHQVSHLTLSAPEPRWPEPGPFPLPRPVQAFDMRPGEDRCLRPRGTPAPDGWAYGLPRGIAPEQWPVSWNDGRALQHHFTVRVPASYRTQGPDRVALAFFSEEYASMTENAAVRSLAGCLFDGRDLPLEADADLKPLLERLRRQHQHVYYHRDVLTATFASIWLTETEFVGPECEPPEPLDLGPHTADPPEWLRRNLLKQRVKGERVSLPPGVSEPGRWDPVPLHQVAREDVNVGKVPVQGIHDEPNPDGYVALYSDEGDTIGLEAADNVVGFGGTVNHCQWMPPLTPFHMHVEDGAGGISLGMGNGQLDLVTMRFDWAC